MAATPYVASHPSIRLAALATLARRLFDELAYLSRMRSSSKPNHLLNKILTKLATFTYGIETSLLEAQIGYQLATDVILFCTEEEGLQSHANLESMRELSGKGHEIARSIMDNFRDIKQQIYKIADSTKDVIFIVVIPPDATHAETLNIPMKDIGTRLVANLDLLTEFSYSVEATAKWWNYVKADLDSPNPTVLPLQRGSSDEIFSKWVEIQQGFEQYYHKVNSAHERFPELLVSSSTD